MFARSAEVLLPSLAWPATGLSVQDRGGVSGRAGTAGGACAAAGRCQTWRRPGPADPAEPGPYRVDRPVVVCAVLYIALTRRRRQDWLVCAGYAAAVIAGVILVGTGPPDGSSADLAGGLILLLMGVAATHSFVALRPGGALAQAATARRAGFGQPDQHAAVQAAKDRMRMRAQARKLAEDNPALARDLKIGRPDLDRSYDDGGLVDVNHVGAEVLVRYLDLSPAEAEAMIAARDQLGRFSSCPEVSAYANLPPDRLDSVSDLMVFG